MKTKITSICFAIMLLMTAFNAQAKTFYILSGEPFSLKPAIGSFYQYQWLEGGNPTTGTVANDGTLTRTFTLANNSVAEIKTISLGVLDAAGGCLSTLINHTVVVLPKVTLAVVPVIANFCQDLAQISTDITASLGETVISGLPTGVTLGTTYKWFKDNVEIDGATTDKITATAVGVYKAERFYDLPTTGELASAGSKLTNALVGSTTIQKSQTAAPTTPDITLQ